MEGKGGEDNRGMQERQRGRRGGEGGGRAGRGLNGYIFGAGLAECSAFLRKFPRESPVTAVLGLHP